MILDATAGNRTMWQHKNSENIIYLDMERQLERKPTIFADNTKTPFKPKIFDTIFYDPPHTWGVYNHWHSYPKRTEEYLKKFNDKAIPRYYGWDKYATKSELLRHVYEAGKEFYRILKDDGLLWLKWNEMKISIHTILGLLPDWNELLRIYVKAPSQTAGKHQTYWICLEKKKKKYEQLTLA